MAKKKETEVIDKVSQLESKIVQQHCNKVETDIINEVGRLERKVNVAIDDFKKFAKDLDLNIERCNVETHGAGIEIGFKFDIDRAKIEKKERSKAIEAHLRIVNKSI